MDIARTHICGIMPWRRNSVLFARPRPFAPFASPILSPPSTDKRDVVLTLMFVLIGATGLRFELLTDLLQQLGKPIWRLRPRRHAAMWLIHCTTLLLDGYARCW